MAETHHTKNQSDPPKAHDLVKPGSTIDPKKGPQGGAVAGQQQGQQGQQQDIGFKQPNYQKEDQERQQRAWEEAAEREKSNNPATREQRQYDKNAPGMHPANQPAPDTKQSKGTRLDLEDITGNPGHRGVNPDAPAGSINKAPDDRTGKIESINEPDHIDQNAPPAGARSGQARTGVPGSINEPAGSQVIPPGAGQGSGGAGGGEGTEYQTPEIDALEPDEIELGAAATTLNVSGSGFTNKSVISMNGEDVPTTFVSDSEVTTPLDPAQWTAAGVVTVTVKNGGYKSEEVELEILEAGPAASRQTKRTKPKPQGKKRK